jgi:hypothetical protein
MAMPASLAVDVELMLEQQECIKGAQGSGEWRGGGQVYVRCCMGITIPPFLVYSITFGVFTKIGGWGILNHRKWGILDRY